MPLYEYACDACGGREERLQSFDAPASHDCPACAAPGGMRRQLSRTAFVLSGGGWYANGYGEAKASSPAEAKPAEAGATTAPGCSGGCACHAPAASAAPGAAAAGNT